MAAARKKLEAPGDKYTSIRASLKAQDGPEDTKNADFQTYPATSTGRRLALAQWIANERNPLTARVLVNHLWLRHFGASLVPDVTDFGRRCPPPLHQDVLDTLAVGFHAARLEHEVPASRDGPLAALSPQFLERRRDGGDARRRSRQRLLLAHEPAPPRIASRARFPAASRRAARSPRRRPEHRPRQGGSSLRRAIYFAQTADVEHRFLAAFDNSNVLECYRRQESIVPQQALALANSKLTRECADAHRRTQRDASRMRNSSSDAFLSLLSRPPTSEESAACLESLAEFAKLNRRPRPLARAPGADEPQRLRHPPMTPDPFSRQFLTRRGFLDRLGTGLAGIALQAMFARESRAALPDWKPPNGLPFFPPKAKRVIWLFMRGGVSHMESFDPKPMLTQYAGKSIGETPYKDVQDRRRS